MRSRSIYSALLVASSALGCGGLDTVGNSNLLSGTYLATIFLVTPTGQAQSDVLAAGGSLSITIDESGNTTGSLNIPGTVTGGAAFTASMAGTATVTGLTVEFNQAADSFVRDLTWARIGPDLSVANQVAGSASFTITLTHQ